MSRPVADRPADRLDLVQHAPLRHYLGAGAATGCKSACRCARRWAGRPRARGGAAPRACCWSPIAKASCRCAAPSDGDRRFRQGRADGTLDDPADQSGRSIRSRRATSSSPRVPAGSIRPGMPIAVVTHARLRDGAIARRCRDPGSDRIRGWSNRSVRAAAGRCAARRRGQHCQRRAADDRSALVRQLDCDRSRPAINRAPSPCWRAPCRGYRSCSASLMPDPAGDRVGPAAAAARAS